MNTSIRRNAPAGVWFKSSFSNPNGNQCVEVRFDNDLVHIRDSKNHGTGPVLTLPTRQWSAFVAAVRDAQFDLPTVAALTV